MINTGCVTLRGDDWESVCCMIYKIAVAIGPSRWTPKKIFYRSVHRILLLAYVCHAHGACANANGLCASVQRKYGDSNVNKQTAASSRVKRTLYRI